MCGTRAETMASRRWKERFSILSCVGGLPAPRTNFRLRCHLLSSHDGARMMEKEALVRSSREVLFLEQRARRWKHRFCLGIPSQGSQCNFSLRGVSLSRLRAGQHPGPARQCTWSCMGGTFHLVLYKTPVVSSRALSHGAGIDEPCAGPLAITPGGGARGVSFVTCQYPDGTSGSPCPPAHSASFPRSSPTACHSSRAPLSSSVEAAASFFHYPLSALLPSCRSSVCFFSVASRSRSHAVSPASPPTGSLPSSPASVPTSSPTSTFSCPPGASPSPSSTSPAGPSPSLPPALPFRAEGRTMPGQRLLPCTQKHIEILSSFSVRYPNPQEVEGGVVVRLVRLQDPVTSPVLRSVRNRQYGIRGNERWWILGVGMLGTGLLAGLGMWQLGRMQWKQKLIEYRRRQLRRPPVWIKSEPFPWVPAECGGKGEKKTSDGAGSSPVSETARDREGTSADHAGEQEGGSHGGQSALSEEDRVISERDVRAQRENSQCVSLPSADCLSLPHLAAAERPAALLEGCAPDAVGSEAERSRLLALWAYRPVVVRGVLDTSTELVVGPRPGLEPGSPGYVFVSPLRLEDGSTLLVNKGHLPMEKAKLPAFGRGVERREGPWCVREMNLKLGAAALNDGQSVSSLRGRACGGIDLFQKQSREEPPGWVTVRGVLDPGETPNTTWSSLLAGNRPKEGQFIFLVPADLVDGLRPGSVKNRRSCAAMLVSAYDIVYDEDILEARERLGTGKDGRGPRPAQAAALHSEASSCEVSETAQGVLNGEVREGNTQVGLLTPSMRSAGISDANQAPSAELVPQPLASPAAVSKSQPGLHDPSPLVALLGLSGVRRRFSDYQQKRRDDYLLFWADEHTHFNYACQWFVMALCAASMTLYKFVQVSRWRW